MPYITETYWITTQTTTNTPSWNAGARTIATLPADGAFSFSVGQSIGIVCGLNANDQSVSYLEIDHGFLIEDTRYRVVENGVYKTAWASYSKSATFKIARRWGVVTYLLDDVLIYTSAAPSSGTVFLDASFYAYDDTITSVAIEEYNDTPVPLAGNLYPLTASAIAGGKAYPTAVDGSLHRLVAQLVDGEKAYPTAVDGDLYPLVGFGATEAINQLVGEMFPIIASGPVVHDLTPCWINGELAALITGGSPNDLTPCWVNGELVALTATGLSDDNRLSGSLSSLIGKASVGVVSLLAGNLASLTGGAETSSFIPEYNQLIGELYPLRVGGLQYDPDPGTVDATLASLDAFGADQDVMLLDGVLSPLTTEIVLGAENYLVTSWSSWYSVSRQLVANATVDVTFPAWVLEASGHSWDNAHVVLDWPAPILTSRAGGSVNLSFPAWELAATAISPGFARVEIEFPSPLLTATGLTGTRADAALDWPTWTLTAQGGGFAELEWPEFILTAAGTVVYNAQVELTWPEFTLTAMGKTGTRAAVTLDWPSFVIDSHGAVGGLATVTLTFPAWVLTADDGATPNETTYAINLTTGAVTTLLLGEFTRLVTAHGRLYGLRGDELVRLDGDTDGTALIPATVRFAQQTFGSNRAKRLSTVYIESREDDGLTLDVIADEQTAWRYQTATDTARAYGTHKVKVGRGVKFHTAGLVVKNCNGGRMDIGGMELLVDTGAPRPKS